MGSVVAGLGASRGRGYGAGRYAGRAFCEAVMTLGHLRLAVVAAALVMGAPSAFAFQIVGPSAPGGVSGSNFTDPDAKTDNMASQYQSGKSGGMNSLKFGNTTVQFGGSGTDNY